LRNNSTRAIADLQELARRIQANHVRLQEHHFSHGIELFSVERLKNLLLLRLRAVQVLIADAFLCILQAHVKRRIGASRGPKALPAVLT
jgi:hypothetical protein